MIQKLKNIVYVHPLTKIKLMQTTNGYTQERANRKEIILNVRAQLRQNEALRTNIVKSICDFLNLSEDSLSLSSHLTLALDEEINDEQGHVIL